MGSPDFAVPSLKAVCAYFAADVVTVFSQPDKRRGRGKIMSPTPVRQWALDHNIPTYTPLNKTEVAQSVDDIKPDLIVVVAYGMILPAEVVDNYLCVNGHASLLPDYRGASPIHSALLNGDMQTGTTLIKMNAKMDEGDMLKKKSCVILPADDLQSLHDTLAELTAEAFAEWLRAEFENELFDGDVQDHSNASYCKKLSTTDRELNLADSAEINMNKIRAFSPIPGAFLTLKSGKIIKILVASIVDGHLTPLIVKPEGKKEMPYTDYLLANPPII